MSIRVKRTNLDFLVRDYKSAERRIEILPPGSAVSNHRAQPAHPDNFIQRWYLSLTGEDAPLVSKTEVSREKPSEQAVYRYDWAFGITLLEGFWWDWMNELPDESALAVHMALQPSENAPEAAPVLATLSALSPSRNTKSLWESAGALLPKAAAEMAKKGSAAIPALDYASSGLMFASNVLDSYTDSRKNWFLYQFYDEKLNSPMIEWRINKKVLQEYGPLLRGTLFLAFHGAPKAAPGSIKILLRPHIRFSKISELDFIAPTNSLSPQDQVFIEVRPGTDAP